MHGFSRYPNKDADKSARSGPSLTFTRTWFLEAPVAKSNPCPKDPRKTCLNTSLYTHYTRSPEPRVGRRTRKKRRGGGGGRGKNLGSAARAGVEGLGKSQ